MLVRCGACQERMTVGDDAFGQLVGCPTCGTAVRIPAVRPAAVPPVAVTPQAVTPPPLPPVQATQPVQPVQPLSVQPVQPVQPAGMTSRATMPPNRGGALVHRCPRCGSDVEHGNALCPRCGVNIKRAKRRRR